MSAEIRTGSLRDLHKVEPSGAVNSRELMAEQPSSHRNSNHSRELGRKSSATNFRLQGAAVARNISLHDPHTERYPSVFRGLLQSKVIEQHHTPREPSQFGQSGSSPKRLQLDRRSIHQEIFRNRGTDIGRLGAVDLKIGRVNDQIRRARDDNHKVEEDDRTKSTMDSQIRRQIESSAEEQARCDDFVRHPRSKSPMVLDQLDLMASYRLRDHSPVTKTVQSLTRLNGSVLSNVYIALANSFHSASGIGSSYTLRNPQGQHAADDLCRGPPAPVPSALNPFRRHLSLPRSAVVAPSIHIASNDGPMGSTIPGKLTNGNDVITPISTSAMSISSGSTPSPSFTSFSGRNPHHQKRNTCIMCKRPEVPIIDLLVRCNGCHCRYHTSCHNPKITCTKGDM